MQPPTPSYPLASAAPSNTGYQPPLRCDACLATSVPPPPPPLALAPLSPRRQHRTTDLLPCASCVSRRAQQQRCVLQSALAKAKPPSVHRHVAAAANAGCAVIRNCCGQPSARHGHAAAVLATIFTDTVGVDCCRNSASAKRAGCSGRGGADPNSCAGQVRDPHIINYNPTLWP